MTTLTRRRRLTIPMAVAAALAVAALALLLSPAAAQEGDAPVLLSNVGQERAGLSVGAGTFDYAQRFTTGSARDGYRLGSIELRVLIRPSTPSDVTIALWSATSGATPEPDAEIAALTHSTGT